MDDRARAIKIITLLKRATQKMPPPASSVIVEKYGRDPYLVLISCLLSLRTRDTVSLPASIRLFEFAKTPEQMLKVPVSKIEKVIYPTGFYRRKARLLHEVSRDLLDRFKGKVPHTMEELFSIKGVGRKTANLVLGEGFKIPAICVDIHVHRISNRLGLVKTKNPDDTETALRELLPKKYWIDYNHLLGSVNQF